MCGIEEQRRIAQMFEPLAARNRVVAAQCRRQTHLEIEFVELAIPCGSGSEQIHIVDIDPEFNHSRRPATTGRHVQN